MYYSDFWGWIKHRNGRQTTPLAIKFLHEYRDFHWSRHWKIWDQSISLVSFLVHKMTVESASRILWRVRFVALRGLSQVPGTVNRNSINISFLYPDRVQEKATILLWQYFIYYFKFEPSFYGSSVWIFLHIPSYTNEICINNLNLYKL